MSNAGTVRTDKGGRPVVDARTGIAKVAAASKPKAPQGNRTEAAK